MNEPITDVEPTDRGGNEVVSDAPEILPERPDSQRGAEDDPDADQELDVEAADDYDDEGEEPE